MSRIKSAKRKQQAVVVDPDEQLLNQSIREKLYLRVGFRRLFVIIIPFSMMVTGQTASKSVA